VESAGYVDQIDDDGNPIDYFDYQIPRLNNESSSDYFLHPDDFYYTESNDLIVSEGDKNENLTDGKGNLRYDGSMPASIEYIYPRPIDVSSKVLVKSNAGVMEISEKRGFVFEVSPDYWSGFLNNFLPPLSGGSPSGKTKPISIKIEAQLWDGSSWGKIDIGLKDNLITAGQSLSCSQPSVGGVYGRGVSSSSGFIHYEDVDIEKRYRFKILKETYRKYSSSSPDGYEEFTNENLRVP
jgi:hypothetical protein